MDLIHFVGLTACGKATLIKKLCDPQNVELRERFSITGTTKAFLDPHHKHYKPEDGFWLPVGQLVHEIETGTAKHFLHKWQYGTRKLPRSILADCHGLRQRAIALWLPDEVWEQRCKEREEKWPRSESWSTKILPAIEGLVAMKIDVETVDASRDNYPPITAWEEDSIIPASIME